MNKLAKAFKAGFKKEAFLSDVLNGANVMIGGEYKGMGASDLIPTTPSEVSGMVPTVDASNPDELSKAKQDFLNTIPEESLPEKYKNNE